MKFENEKGIKIETKYKSRIISYLKSKYLVKGNNSEFSKMPEMSISQQTTSQGGP